MERKERTFLTRPPGKQKSSFEMKYLERFGTGESRVGLPGLSPQLVEK
jgi:hypothetical protein